AVAGAWVPLPQDDRQGDQEVRDGPNRERLHLLAHLRAPREGLLSLQRRQVRQRHLPPGWLATRPRQADLAGRRRPLGGLEGGQDRVPVRRRQHAGAQGLRVYVQQGATGGGEFFHEGSRDGLEARGGALRRVP
ncbi:unnamed protein product, partial [Ectocarpus sp. 8 AP-2014]